VYTTELFHITYRN